MTAFSPEAPWAWSPRLDWQSDTSRRSPTVARPEAQDSRLGSHGAIHTLKPHGGARTDQASPAVCLPSRTQGYEGARQAARAAGTTAGSGDGLLC